MNTVVNSTAVVGAYGVTVQITPEDTTMAPTDTGSWQVEITNEGYSPDTYDLTAGGITAHFATFSQNPVSLAPGQSTTVQMTADDMGFALIRSYPVEVAAQSLFDSHIRNSDTANLTFTGYEAVEVGWLPASQTLTDTLTATYLLLITNTGNVDTIYSLDVMVAGLDVSLEVDEVYIPPHMTAGIVATVQANAAGIYTLSGRADSTTSAATGSGPATLVVTEEALVGANDDVATLFEDTAITIPVLANDQQGGGGLTVTEVTQPVQGMAVINPDNTVTYTPTANYNGVDGFFYTIDNGQGVTDTAVVNITVMPVNDPAVIHDDAAVIAPNTVVTISVLANDYDLIDGDTIYVTGVSQPVEGMAVLNPDQTVTVSPTLDYVGLITFTYFVTETGGSGDQAQVTVLVAETTQINFQRPESDTPPGFLADGGEAYGLRENGYSYGWISPTSGLPVDNTANARDRDWWIHPADQRYDTLNHMQTYGEYSWEMAAPDGWYLVTLVAGDPEWTNGIYRLDVEGVLTVEGQPNKGQYWVAGTSVVQVTDGRLTISNNPAATGNNKVAFVSITALGHALPVGLSRAINFQPAGAETPVGYEADVGALFGERGNGYSYGWDMDMSSRMRDRDWPTAFDQRYDTTAMMQFGPTATWEMEVPNGIYVVRLVNGDPRYYIDHHYDNLVEGVTVGDGTNTPVNRYRSVEVSVIVAVNDGRLTVAPAPGARRHKLQFVEIQRLGD